MKPILLLLVLACAVPLRADPPALSEALQLRARIVQLEAQLQKLATEGQVCNARLALTVQPQQEQATKAAMQAIEKEAGCAIEWSAAPPVCRPIPPSKND